MLTREVLARLQLTPAVLHIHHVVGLVVRAPGWWIARQLVVRPAHTPLVLAPLARKVDHASLLDKVLFVSLLHKKKKKKNIYIYINLSCACKKNVLDVNKLLTFDNEHMDFCFEIEKLKQLHQIKTPTSPAAAYNTSCSVLCYSVMKKHVTRQNTNERFEEDQENIHTHTREKENKKTHLVGPAHDLSLLSGEVVHGLARAIRSTTLAVGDVNHSLQLVLHAPHRWFALRPEEGHLTAGGLGALA